MTLQALLIIGDPIKDHKSTDSLSKMKGLMNLYLKRGYLAVGAYRELTPNDLTIVFKEVDENTRIDMIFHGQVDDEGSHYMSVFGGFLKTDWLLSDIRSMSSLKSLNIHLWSCYGKYALSGIKYLAENSTLTIHSGNQAVLSDIYYYSLEQAIKGMQKLSHSISSFQSFLTNMASSAIQEAHFTTKISDQIYQFSIIPPTKEILQDAEGFLNAEALRFIEFYNNLNKNFDNAYKAQNNLDLPSFTNQEISYFRVGAFIANCHKNYQLIESSYLLANDTIAASVVNEEINSITPLFAAAENEQIDVIKLLLESGAKIDKRIGTSPLYVAVQNGYIGVVKLLLESGAEVDKVEWDNFSFPLYIAAQKGHTEVLKLLLVSGAKVNKKSHHGSTTIFVAAQKGNIDVIKLLLESGAEVNVTDTKGITPLHIASQEGHIDVIKLLLESGAEIDATNTEGITPLHIAAQEGHIDVVKLLLLELDTKVEVASTTTIISSSENSARHSTVHRNAALFVAVQNGNTEVVKLLLDSGAKVNTKKGYRGVTTLFIAAQKGHVDVVKLLLESGSEIDMTDTEGITPLYVAAQEGHIEVAKCLIDYGSKVHQDKKSCLFQKKKPCLFADPLYAATKNGHIGVAKLLLDSGAEIEVASPTPFIPSSENSVRHSTIHRNTPLFVAVQNGNTGLIKLLLESGTLLNKANEYGETPLYIAAQEGHTEVVKLLLELGAKVNYWNNEQTTPLFISVQKGHIEVVKLLLESGAIVEQANKYGMDPILYASYHLKNDLLEILVKYDAIYHNKVDPPLYIAAKNGDISTVKLLLESGAKDVDYGNNKGMTPLYIALYCKNYVIAKILVKCGADPLMGIAYNTPYDIAILQGNIEIVHLLTSVVNKSVEYHKENCSSYIHNKEIETVGDATDIFFHDQWPAWFR